MEKFLVFGILTIPIVIISWRTLFNIKTHGFYRFFAWEGILWLAINNYKYWFDYPLSLLQIFSWILLSYSLLLLILGILQLIKFGKPHESRNEKALFNIEKTTILVDEGIFKYIRHPIYGSLIFLTWGIFFKSTNLELLLISIASTVLLYITAKFDEKECIVYFGESYRKYMTLNKMFIPYIM
ncbi:MAG: DUF1295 domain-containing protein [Bacteroidetes bacterium]|nr:DUF1295 domain-containing protein [Bacteroidota bacterium]